MLSYTIYHFQGAFLCYDVININEDEDVNMDKEKYLKQIAEDLKWIKWILILLFIYFILSGAL